MTSDQNVVGGRYELGDILGRGGMAEVRRAVDTRLGRQVAVKQLRTDLATDPTFQARFRREAQSAAGLNHPTIVAVYDTGEETDPVTGISIPYIVMELVEGQTLREVLRDGRKILPERALELTQGVLDALSYSHKAGIVHRDIKPANVMLTGNGSVKVMDFGIARAVADTSATMTQTAAVIGTAQYLSPEQARGETVDARSDVYSAGCLLYELLVGRPPFVGESPVSVAYQHVREAPVPPSQLDSMITPEVDAITLKALAKDPDDRYQSAREMKADIARVLAGEQSTAMVPAVAEETCRRPAWWRRCRLPYPSRNPWRRRSRSAASGCAVLIGAAHRGVARRRRLRLYRVLQPTTPPAPALIAVPNVVTYNETQAKDRLTDVGLVARVVAENGSEDTKDQVTATEPGARHRSGGQQHRHHHRQQGPQDRHDPGRPDRAQAVRREGPAGRGRLHECHLRCGHLRTDRLREGRGAHGHPGSGHDGGAGRQDHHHLRHREVTGAQPRQPDARTGRGRRGGDGLQYRYRHRGQ